MKFSKGFKKKAAIFKRVFSVAKPKPVAKSAITTLNEKLFSPALVGAGPY